MTGDTSVEARHGGFAAARDQTVNYAPSAELIEALTRPLENLNEHQRAEIRDLRDKLGTSEGVLHRVAALLTEHLEVGHIRFDQIPELLIDMVKQRQAVAKREHSRAPDPDAALAHLQEQLTAALEAGDDDQVRKLLQEKRDAKLAAMTNRREAAGRLREAASRDLIEAAECEADLGMIALGRLEYRIAAEHFRAAADLISAEASQTDERLDYGNRAAEALYKQGLEFGENGALEEAVQAYKSILEERPRERVPLDWAMTQNNLGAALSSLGARESGTAQLEEAVAAYQEALSVFEAAGASYLVKVTRENLESVQGLLAERRGS